MENQTAEALSGSTGVELAIVGAGNMAEAIALHLESLRALGKKIPKPKHRLVLEELSVPEFA